MFESISFWLVYGALSYILYVGVFTGVLWLLGRWVYHITDGDFPTYEQWRKLYTKWLPVDEQVSFIVIAISIGIFLIAYIESFTKGQSIHESLVIVSNFCINVGYALMVGVVLLFLTKYLKRAYKFGKNIHNKINKL